MAVNEALAGTESPKDFGPGVAGSAQRWISEINLAEKDQNSWRTRARKIIKIYTEQQDEASIDVKKRRFSLLWSNVETLSPAVYARTPSAVVGRRYKDADPLGRLASEILERALNFSLDAVDFADVMTGIKIEFLLVARGQAWVRYVPHMKTVTPDAPPLLPDGQVSEGAEPYEVVEWEEAIPDHVTWDDFLHNPARKWSEVRWCGRIVYMTRDELVERFPTCGQDVPLDHGPDPDTDPAGIDDQFKKAAVYEIWDKTSRKVFWISKAYTQSSLDERPDPLQLQDFFPCPRPVLGTKGPGSMIPTPDYVYYEAQAKDINELTVRIGLLTDGLKMRGFYAAGDQTGKSLQDLMTTETGTLIPVDSWAAFAEKGGVKGLIEWIPLDMVVATLKGCIEARKQLLDDVFQLTGIADIMRGDTDPDETATAQKLKSNWGSSRVRDKQKELGRFARDILRIMGQVIATKFSPETLSAMTNIQLLPTTAAKQALQQQLQQAAQQWQIAAQHAQSIGQPPPPQPQPPPQLTEMLGKPTWEEVTGLLKDNTLRAFRVDIETDSTIEPNDQDEKQRRIEFIQAVGEFVAKSIPAIQLVPAMAPVCAQSLLFLVRGFRVGREMEDVIEKAMDQLQSAAGSGGMQQQQKPAGPDPHAEQIKAQAAQTNAQANVMQAQVAQGHLQVEGQKVASQHQIGLAQVQAENMRTDADRQAELHMHNQGLQADLQQGVLKSVERREIRDINSERPITAPTQ